jgi:predicted nuclease with TOPRIM domain
MSRAVLKAPLRDQEQSRRLAINEIEELRESLRYAEFVLAKTRQEKEQVERELQEHDQRVNAVRQEVAQRAHENKQLEQQVTTLSNHAHFADMATAKVQEVARAKLVQLQTEIA